MAKEGTNESEDFEYDEDYFGNDEELDDGDDEEFDVTKLSKSERKRFEKLKSEVEESVVKAIAAGDTNSEVYKGIQRVLARRDRELAETRMALASVIKEVQGVSDIGDNLEFVQNIMKDMLDDDSKKVYDERYSKHKSEKENRQQRALLESLLSGQGQPNFNPQYIPYGNIPQEEDPQIREYRKQATTKLKAFAKKMGVDPDNDDLDFGSEDDALLVRMDKLAASIERAKAQDDDEIDRVRSRGGSRPQTRTRNEPANPGRDIATDILSRGSARMIEQMRKIKH